MSKLCIRRHAALLAVLVGLFGCRLANAQDCFQPTYNGTVCAWAYADLNPSAVTGTVYGGEECGGQCYFTVQLSVQMTAVGCSTQQATLTSQANSNYVTVSCSEPDPASVCFNWSYEISDSWNDVWADSIPNQCWTYGAALYSIQPSTAQAGLSLQPMTLTGAYFEAGVTNANVENSACGLSFAGTPAINSSTSMSVLFNTSAPQYQSGGQTGCNITVSNPYGTNGPLNGSSRFPRPW